MALYASRIKRDHRPPRLPGPARPAGHGWEQGARAARPCAQKAPDVGSATQALQRPPAFRSRPVRFVPDLVTPYIRRLQERRAMTRAKAMAYACLRGEIHDDARYRAVGHGQYRSVGLRPGRARGRRGALGGGPESRQGVFGSGAGGTVTCKSQAIAFQPTNSFIGEVADFVQATQQQRVPCATLMDGLRNVYIMETARESPLQRPL
jgi:hypothetical protein